MDVLIEYSENTYLKAKSLLQDIAETSVQEIVNDYLELNIGSLGAASFKKLFTGPAEMIFDKMTGGKMEMNGFNLSKQKAIELIEKPKGYDILINKISSTMTGLKSKTIQPINLIVTPENIDTIFTVNESDEVVIVDSILQRIESRCKKYATSETAKKMHLLGQSIIDKCRELGIERIIMNDGDGMGGFIKNLIISEFNKPLELNIPGIMNYNSK